MRDNTLATKGLLVLSLVIAIDSFGFEMVLPLLAPLFSKSQHFVPVSTDLPQRHIYYGLTLGIYSFMVFLSAPCWGALSDRYGRRLILLICVATGLFAFLGTGICIFYGFVWLFILMRAISGGAAGSEAVAQAWVVESSPAGQRYRYLGFLIAALVVGAIAGPFVSGYLTLGNVSVHWRFARPFFLVFLLSLMNLIILLVVFRSHSAPNKEVNSRQRPGFFSTPGLMGLAFSYLLFQLGWGLYSMTNPIRLIALFHFDALHIGLLIALLGTGFVLSLVFLTPRLLDQFGTRASAVAGCIAMGAMVCLTLIVPTPDYWQYIMAFLVGVANGVGVLSFMSAFAEIGQTESCGFFIGVANASMSLALALSGFLLTHLLNLSAVYVFLIAAALSVLGTVCLTLAKA